MTVPLEHWGVFEAVLEKFDMNIPVDNYRIPMGDMCAIVGVDWLSQLGNMIDCERQLV